MAEAVFGPRLKKEGLFTVDSETQAKRVIIELKPRRLDERVLGFEGKGDWKGKVKALF